MAFRNFISRILRISSSAHSTKVFRKRESLTAALFATSVYASYKLLSVPHAHAKQSFKENDRDIIREADRLYNSTAPPTELYDYIIKFKESKNAEILWRICRASREMALKTPDIKANDKKDLIYEAFEFAKKSLDADDYNYAPHKWYAITIGDVGDYEGTKVKISNAFIIRDHLERAAELNPKDATTFHCLGMWCFVFADMPGWQRTIANFLFATPPTSTYNEAAEYFMKAERVEPNFYSTNLLMLGKTYMRMGDMKRAMLYLDRTIHYPIVNTEDEESKKEAENLLTEVLKRK